MVGALRTMPKGLVKGQEDWEKKRTSCDHPDKSKIRIGRNTEKSPGDLR